MLPHNSVGNMWRTPEATPNNHRDPKVERAAPSQSSLVLFSRAEIVSILFGLILAMFLASLDQTIVATSLSVMAQDLNGWALMSWVVSAYLVASTVTTPLYGRGYALYV